MILSTRFSGSSSPDIEGKYRSLGIYNADTSEYEEESYSYDDENEYNFKTIPKNITNESHEYYMYNIETSNGDEVMRFLILNYYAFAIHSDGINKFVYKLGSITSEHSGFNLPLEASELASHLRVLTLDYSGPNYITQHFRIELQPTYLVVNMLVLNRDLHFCTYQLFMLELYLQQVLFNYLFEHIPPSSTLLKESDSNDEFRNSMGTVYNNDTCEMYCVYNISNEQFTVMHSEIIELLKTTINTIVQNKYDIPSFLQYDCEQHPERNNLQYLALHRYLSHGLRINDVALQAKKINDNGLIMNLSSNNYIKNITYNTLMLPPNFEYKNLIIKPNFRDVCEYEFDDVIKICNEFVKNNLKNSNSNTYVQKIHKRIKSNDVTATIKACYADLHNYVIAEYRTRFFDKHVSIVMQQYEFYKIPVLQTDVEHKLNNIFNKNMLELFFNNPSIKTIYKDISNIIRRIS